MKRGTPDHHKMKRLARLSGVPAVYALAWANGALERLWHYAAKYAIRGDIGRITNREIAEVCCYPIKRADHLIEILVDSEWLDPHPEHRLVIHDWADHADESVRKTIRNRGLAFIPKLSTTLKGGTAGARHVRGNFQKVRGSEVLAQNKTKDLEEDFRESFQFFPECLSFPKPLAVEKEEAVYTHTGSTLGARATHAPTSNGNGASPSALKRLDEFLANYPDRADPDATARAYVRHVTAETEDACHACLERYRASDRVARNVVQQGWKWLEQQSRNKFHGQWALPPAVQRKTVGFEESVTKVLAERIKETGKPW